MGFYEKLFPCVSCGEPESGTGDRPLCIACSIEEQKEAEE